MKYKTVQISDPISLFKRLLQKEKHVCFLHTGNGKGKSIIAWNPVEIFRNKSGKDKDFIVNFRRFVDRNSKLKNEIVGYFSYDIAYKLLNIKRTAKDDLRLPDVYFCAFDNYVFFENGEAKVYYNDSRFLKELDEILERKVSKNPLQKPATESKNFKPIMTRTAYNKAYEKIKKHIKEGDVYQINLTHRLEAKTDLAARELFLRTVEANPVEFLAYIEGDGFEILSASPERFVKIERRRIETCPIKGTRPRGKTKSQDLEMKKELLGNRKEAMELNMITDLLRNDLGKVCEVGSVKVEEHRTVFKCPTVWHTYSKITGIIDKRLSPIDAIISMLPGGSVTGCPKKRAAEIIDELEPVTRGIYTGVIGHIEKSNLDFNIAIRTMIKKKNSLYLQVGGGIVLDSENQMEYEETLHKAESFMKILC